MLEIAGQKKGLLLLAGLLSVGSAMCMLVPYWAVYEVLKELLLHGSNPVLANGTEMIRWGWIALDLSADWFCCTLPLCPLM